MNETNGTPADCCVICGRYLPEGWGMVCSGCLEKEGLPNGG